MAKYSELQPGRPRHGFHTVEGNRVQILHVCMRDGMGLVCSANEIFPELKDLPPLPIHEMALRLCFLYDDHDRHPEHEDISECALALRGNRVYCHQALCVSITSSDNIP